MIVFSFGLKLLFDFGQSLADSYSNSKWIREPTNVWSKGIAKDGHSS